MVIARGTMTFLFYSDYSYIKKEVEVETRGLVSIEQVPVRKSILVTGFSDDTTYEEIELFFESRRNNGGTVEKVTYVPERHQAIVVFQEVTGLLLNDVYQSVIWV